MLTPSLVYAVKDQELTLSYPKGYSFYAVQLNEPAARQDLETFLNRQIGQSCRVRVAGQSEAQSGPAAAGAATLPPAQRLQDLAAAFEGAVINDRS